ncbi:MAG: hypothetical protein FWH24_04960 [Oscillospiraceae bacterium]|nr:hypothetical protein [Oscillospiraceae bacterium]
MDFTVGEIYFYGGIAGMAVTLIGACVVIIIMSGSRKRLLRKFNMEYGAGETEK